MKAITIEGCACVVGRYTDHRNSMWVVREPITGLAVSNPSNTRKEAIADAARKIKAAGGAEMFNYAIESQMHAQP